MSGKLQFWNITPAPGSCPWAQRAWIALNEKNIKYDTHLADKAAKPKEFLQVYEEIWPDANAVAKVPTIIDTDGTKLTESAVVVEYLEQKYKSQGSRLVPDDPALAAKARLFVEIYSATVTANYRKVIQAKTKTEVSEAKQALVKGIAVVEKYLQANGSSSGPFLLGNDYSIAEVLTAPFVRSASVLLGAYRDFDLVNDANKAGYKRFGSWVKGVLDRPSTEDTSLPRELTISRGKTLVAEVEE